MLQLTSSCCAWLLWACICSLNLAERRPQSISKPFLRLKFAIPVSFLQIRTTRTPHSRADEVVCSKKQKNMDTWTNNTCSCQQYVTDCCVPRFDVDSKNRRYFYSEWWKGRWGVRGVARDEFWAHQKKDIFTSLSVGKVDKLLCSSIWCRFKEPSDIFLLGDGRVYGE